MANLQNLVIVNDPDDWPLSVPGVEVVQARHYLTRPEYSRREPLRVFNLCRSYRYQKTGYYVSLLAEARGHRPMPDISTIQDLKSSTILRLAADELEGHATRSLSSIKSAEFVCSVYFGQNLAERHQRLAGDLFRRFPAPFLRATFAHDPKTHTWILKKVATLGVSEIPEGHRDFVEKVAAEYFRSRYRSVRRPTSRPYSMAILVDPEEKEPPSNAPAIKRFVRAAETVGFDVEIIDKEDYGRLAEFDALFIRETTGVNHRTFRFARRAAAQGLVVLDDPDSILKCCNKVFLAELVESHKIPAPETMIVHKANVGAIRERLGLPCILKQPDSSFSQGVKKAETPEELAAVAEDMLESSDLVIAQRFIPTAFDWRIGVVDRQPLFASKYRMATDHWQIYRRDKEGKVEAGGGAETIPVELAPTKVVKVALKAANAIGDGLYGVDLKEVDGSAYLIEVNDNPNIDAGVEDAVLKDELYLRIARVFLSRVERKKAQGR